VVPIVGAIVAIVSGAAAWLSGDSVGQVIVGAAGSAFVAGIQALFWITVVFAIAERTGGADAFGTTGEPWTPDRLPEVPARERLGLGEAIASVVANVIVIGALVWLQAASPIVIEGVRYPLFDPALWSFWMPYFIVVAGIEILFAVALYLRGRWTWLMAIANAVLNAAFAIPALWLLREGLLFNPELIAELERLTGGLWFNTTAVIIGIVIVIVIAIDTLDGFRKAWHNTRQVPVVTAIA
jgi:hypothetical protein